jgi:hypothetical protein
MEIHRSLGVSRLVALMSAHRRHRAHDQLLASLDRLVAEARRLCKLAEEFGSNDDSEGAIADAFQTVLARPTREWMERAETVVGGVRPSSDTICGARAKELRVLVDTANVAVMRRPSGHDAWRGFYRSVLNCPKSRQIDRG